MSFPPRFSQRNKNAGPLLRVKRDHPLANALLDCIVFGPGGNYGLVNLNLPALGHGNANQPSILTTSTKNAVWTGAADGPGLHIANGTSPANDYCYIIPDWVNYAAGGGNTPNTTTGLSWFVKFTVNAFGAGGVSAVFEKGDGTTTEIAVWLNNIGQWRFTYIGNVGDGSTFNTGIAIGVPASVGLSFDPATVNAYYYALGVNIATNSGHSFSTVGVAHNLHIGRAANAGQSDADQTFHAFYTWRRYLTSVEQLQLDRDPYCFLEPAVQPMVSVQTAAVVDEQPHFLGKFAPPFMRTPSYNSWDTSQSNPPIGPETNPHFLGKFIPSKLIVPKPFHLDTSINGPLGPQVEAEPHFLGRFTPPILKVPQPFHRDTTPDSTQPTDGGANPHFIGRFVVQGMQVLALLRMNVDSSFTIVAVQEANPHFIARFQPPLLKVPNYFHRDTSTDATQPSEGGAEPSFLGKFNPPQMNLLVGLRMNIPPDVFVPVTGGGQEHSIVPFTKMGSMWSM